MKKHENLKQNSVADDITSILKGLIAEQLGLMPIGPLSDSLYIHNIYDKINNAQSELDELSTIVNNNLEVINSEFRRLNKELANIGLLFEIITSEVKGNTTQKVKQALVTHSINLYMQKLNSLTAGLQIVDENELMPDKTYIKISTYMNSTLSISYYLKGSNNL